MADLFFLVLELLTGAPAPVEPESPDAGGFIIDLG